MNIEIAPKETMIRRANWYEARMYCFSLNIDGKIGWRLPTKEELDEIYHSENDFEKRWYWSSTDDSGNSAWNQDFNDGYQTRDDKNYNKGCVRAIRPIS